MKLTSRQELLLSRLAALGQAAIDRRLPVEVVEILGFGSFFRGKERPKDVDLLIRCTREFGRAFSTFRVILESVSRNNRFQSAFDKPVPAFLDEYDRHHADMIPGLVSIDEERALFERWLEPYSWQMLYPKSIADACAWDDPYGFTRRLLRREFPNLNVAYFIYPEVTPDQLGLRAGFTEVIWTREKPDIRENSLAALAPQRVLANTRKDLENFDRQLFRLQATLRLLERLARRDSRESIHDIPEMLRHTLLEYGTSLKEDEAHAELGMIYQEPCCDERAPRDLGMLVEKRRADVKKLWDRVEAMRKVVHLKEWHADGYCGPPMPLDEFLAAELLSGKSAKQQAVFRSILGELGFRAV